MGMGGGPREADDYEWCSLADLSTDDDAPSSLQRDAEDWVRDNPVWQPGSAERVLVVDLDNLRADGQRLQGRLARMVAVANTADRAHFCGQAGTVSRSLPWLGAFASSVVTAGDDPDEADLVLLAAAMPPRGAHRPMQFAVASNDGIFAVLARHGPVTLLSPSLAASSRRLRSAASRLIDIRSDLGVSSRSFPEPVRRAQRTG
jgi:hypothetical protein